MGVKEELLGKRVLFGYAGQLRPGQVIGGICQSCQVPVWINLPENLAVSSTEYMHFSCHNFKALAVDRELSRVINPRSLPPIWCKRCGFERCSCLKLER